MLPSILVYEIQTRKINTTCIQYFLVSCDVHHQHLVYRRFIQIPLRKFNRTFNMIDDLTIDNILITFCLLQDRAWMEGVWLDDDTGWSTHRSLVHHYNVNIHRSLMVNMHAWSGWLARPSAEYCALHFACFNPYNLVTMHKQYDTKTLAVRNTQLYSSELLNSITSRRPLWKIHLLLSYALTLHFEICD
jgi:hypothetical protein